MTLAGTDSMERCGTNPLTGNQESVGGEKGEAAGVDSLFKVLGCERRKDMGSGSRLPRGGKAFGLF